MEAEESRLSHQELDHQIAIPTSGIPGLDVVRALHQTVISLRSALDSSRKELQRLRKIVGDFQGESYAGAIERLSLENHVLRRKLLDGHKEDNSNDVCISFTTKSPTTTILIQETPPSDKIEKRTMDETDSAGAKVEEEAHDLEVPEKDAEDMSCLSVSECDLQNLTPETKHDDSENESEELNDIELIFTTDETCRDIGLQDDLVSITEPEQWQNPGQSRLLKCSKSVDEAHARDREIAGSSSVEEAISSQNSSIDREENVDISKCGVIEEADHTPVAETSKRNGLVPPSSAYKSIIHRQALLSARRKSSVPIRPVISRGCGVRQESGAQTDISALPGQWRSESYLAHKVAHTFTTLPSKFTLPVGVARRLKVSDKTREARRVLLSDISFTSMVPELSRSDDHLCHDPPPLNGHVITFRGIGYRAPEAIRRESFAHYSSNLWSRYDPSTGLASPCECRISNDFILARHRGSSISIPSPVIEVAEVPIRRHSWRPVVNSVSKSTWSSMPSTPTHSQIPTRGILTPQNSPEKARSRVSFRVCPLNRGSLPNFRPDAAGGEFSGDSTDSLIDEADEYLRQNFDSMMTISGPDFWNRQSARLKRARRYSESDLFREWVTPRKAKPYLPKNPSDLKLGQFLKVISRDGKMVQGKVRYVGPVPESDEVHVGIELPTSTGGSDGTYNGRRFFKCQSSRAIFVPFKKVVLAWCSI